MAGDTVIQADVAASPHYVAVPAMSKPGGHYSHASVGAGLVFVSGQLPITAEGKRLVDASFDEQAAQVLANVASVLAAAGSGTERLLQVRVYLDDIANWPAFDKLYAQWPGRRGRPEPSSPPGRCISA